MPNDDQSRRFWAFFDEAKQTVRKWPDWKQEIQVGIYGTTNEGDDIAMTTPPIGRIEFDGVDPFYRPADAPIKPSVPTKGTGEPIVLPVVKPPQFDWPVGQYVDDLGWKVNVCVAHSYVGHPPCPYIGCPNSNDKVNQRGIYYSVKVERLLNADGSTDDHYRVMDTWVFVREDFRVENFPVRRRWLAWIEVVPRSTDYGSAASTIYSSTKEGGAIAMTKPGNGSKSKHKARAAVRKKQPVSKKPKAMKHKQLGNGIDGLLRRQAAEIGRQRLPMEPESATATGPETEAAGTFQVSFESLSISYPEAMFRDTAESRLLLATTRSRFMREMLAVYDRYAEAARQRYNDIDPTVSRPPIQPMGMMLVDTAAVNVEPQPQQDSDGKPDDEPDDYTNIVDREWGAAI